MMWHIDLCMRGTEETALGMFRLREDLSLVSLMRYFYNYDSCGKIVEYLGTPKG
jgi:hypothetical protein